MWNRLGKEGSIDSEILNIPLTPATIWLAVFIQMKGPFLQEISKKYNVNAHIFLLNKVN